MLPALMIVLPVPSSFEHLQFFNFLDNTTISLKHKVPLIFALLIQVSRETLIALLREHVLVPRYKDDPIALPNDLTALLLGLISKWNWVDELNL